MVFYHKSVEKATISLIFTFLHGLTTGVEWGRIAWYINLSHKMWRNEEGMLVIRLQRTGRKGHAQFRVVVQDSRRTPTSGKVVAQVGTYDPHGKAINLNKERAQAYLDHGAQPSPRVVSLLKSEGVKLPSWVTKADKKKSAIRNPEKLRRNRPAEPKAAEAPADETPAETPAEEPAQDATAEEVATEAAPAEAAEETATEA
jgi:small subunit ribosomal protein S16